MLTKSGSRVAGLVQKMLSNKRRTKKFTRILVPQSQLIPTMLSTLLPTVLTDKTLLRSLILMKRTCYRTTPVMKNLVSSKTTRMTRNVPRAPHPTTRPLLLMSLLSSQSSSNHSSSPRW